MATEAVKRFHQDQTHWIFRSDNSAYDEIRVDKQVCDYPILGTFVAGI